MYADEVLNSSLLSAASNGDAARVKELLSQGASANSQNIANGFSALMASVIHGDTTILKMLLDAGADVNARTTTGETVLLYAVMANNATAAHILVEHVADASARSGMGLYPIDMAKTMSNKEMIIALSGRTSGEPLTVEIDTKSVLLSFSDNLVTRAQGDINKVKQGDSWNLKIAHYLGDKDNDRFFEASAPQRYQLLTPYTIIRDAAYSANSRYQEIDRAIIETLKQLNGVVWLWIWDQGAHDRRAGMAHGTLIHHVVVKVGDKTYQPLDRDIYIPELLFAEKEDIVHTDVAISSLYFYERELSYGNNRFR